MEKKEHNQVNDVINLEKSELYMAEIYKGTSKNRLKLQIIL